MIRPANDPAIRFEGVSVFYGEVVGLSQVTLEMGSGITGIVGPNGSGKSTLMRVLTGLIPASEGAVTVLGGNPFLQESVRTRIGFVPSTECFYDGISGRKNLEVAFLARGHDRPEARELAVKALEAVDLTGDGDRTYRTWSRGMRQRLKLGQALIEDSELVLLDEPFLGVDPPNRRRLRDLIQALGDSGRTVLVSSHVLHEIESLTDRVGVLSHGRLLGHGRVEELLRNLRDQHPHRIRLVCDDPRRFGAALLERGHVSEVQVGKVGLEFVTHDPEVAYRELGRIVGETGIALRAVDTLDNSLEAVFTHVTATGYRRL